MANNIGSKFVKDLTDAIWYVDKCSIKTLNNRYKYHHYFYCEECNPIVSEKKRKTRAVKVRKLKLLKKNS